MRGKSTGGTARAAIRWVEAVSGELFLANSPLIIRHSRPERAPSGVLAKPVPAKPPSLEILRRLEHLITAAPTAVQRCIAGIVVLLAFASARTADLLRTRSLAFTRSSLIGGQHHEAAEEDVSTLVFSSPRFCFVLRRLGGRVDGRTP